MAQASIVAIAVFALLAPSSSAEVPLDRSGDSENIYAGPLPDGAISRLGACAPSPADLLDCARLTSDGRRIVAAGKDGRIRVFDVSTGVRISVAEGNGKRIWRDSALSLDGRTFATQEGWGESKEILLWDLEAGRLIRKVVGTGSLGGVALSPDGSVLAWGGLSRRILFWNVATGDPLPDMPARCSSVLSLEFSPDGETLLAGCEDGTLKLFDIKSRKLTRSVRSDDWRVEKACFSLDGNTIAAGGNSSAVVLNRANDWKAVALDVRGMCLDVSVCDDGSRVVTSCPSTGPFGGGGAPSGIRVWDGRTGAAEPALEGSPPTGRPFLLPDGSRLLLLDRGAIRSWDPGSGREIKETPGHRGATFGLAWCDEGRSLVSVADDGTLMKWTAATGAVACTVPTGLTRSNVSGYRSSAGAGADRFLVVGAEGARVFRLSDGALVGKGVSWEPDLTCAALSPDGRRISTSELGPLSIRSADSGEVLGKLERPRPEENDDPFGMGRGRSISSGSAAWSPDSNRIFWSDWEGKAAFWDVATGIARDVPGLRQMKAAVFSPDGTRLLCHDESDASVLDVAEAKVLHTLRSKGSSVGAIAWSPDGKRLVIGTTAGGIRVFESDSAKEVRSFSAGCAVESLAWSPSGERIASGMADGGIFLWDLGDPPVAPGKLPPDQIWSRLLLPNGVEACTAWQALVSEGAGAVPRIEKDLEADWQREPPPELLRQLDDESAERRSAAGRQIASLGVVAEPALKRVLASNPSAEVRAHVESILRSLDFPIVDSPGSLRRLRAIQALERIGGPEAASLLEKLSLGSRSDRERVWARESLLRIRRGAK